MPKTKLDYVALKKEFMTSEAVEVKGFFLSNNLPYNRQTRENTKWWSKEKKELKAKATEKAIKQVWNKLAKQLEPSTEFLLWNHPMNESYSELTANHLCKGGKRCKSEYQDRVNPHSNVMKCYWQ